MTSIYTSLTQPVLLHLFRYQQTEKLQENAIQQ